MDVLEVGVNPVSQSIPLGGTNARQKANTSQGHRTRVTDNHIGCQQETRILYTHKFGN